MMQKTILITLRAINRGRRCGIHLVAYLMDAQSLEIWIDEGVLIEK